MLCSFDNCGGGFGNVVAEQRGVVGGGRMEDNELEEGEASLAFYNDFDPDVALSYIDDKIHDVLGHFQKEFEGGVSAENLGAKYGGYGSFLPTHQRSPSVLLQPRTPAIVQNYSNQNPPSEGTVERMRTAAAISGSGVNSSKAGSISNHVLSGPAALTVDMVNKGDMPSNAMKGSKEMSPLKKCSVAKNVSGNEQNRIPLLRFKMPTDSVQRSKSSAIYSGLGLDNSPSSFEDSPEDRQESSPGDEYTPVHSPISMIRIMTSYQIPGGFLLTPLREDLVKLPERYDKASARDAKNRTIKVELQEAHATNRNEFDSGMDFQGSKERKGRSDEKQSKYTEAKKENDTEIGKNATNNPKKDLDFENKMGKDFGSGNLKFPIKSFSKENHYERTEREVMGDSGKEKIKGANLPKEASKGGPKDKILRSDLPKNECKEVDGNMDFGRAMKSDARLMPPSGKLECKEKEICQVKEARKGSCYRDSTTEIKKLAKETGMDSKSNDLSKDLTGYKEWNEQKDATNEMSKDKVFVKVFTDEIAGLHKENEKEHGTNNKKKQKEMNRKNSLSKESSKEKSRDLTRSSYKDSRKDKHKHAKDSLTSEAFGESIKAHKELKQAPYKDFQRDHIKDVEQEQSGNRKDSIDIYRKDSIKESRFESMERGSSRAPEREKEREHNLTKVPSSKKLDHASVSEVHVSNAGVSHPSLGAMVSTDPGLVPVAPVLINENWVQCDACEKWRLLPTGVETSSLPQKWLCRMLDWLPFMNRCEISEDESTQAVRALNGQQPAQCQLDASRGQFQPPGVPASAAVLDIKQAEPSHDLKALKSSNISSNGSKKGQVQRSIVSVPGPTNLPSSFSKKSKQSSFKSKSLNDVVQPSLEQVQGSMGLSYQAIKGNDSLIETHKFKQKEKLKMRQNLSDEVGYDTGEGSTPRLKAKRKSEGELDVHKHLKKSKAKDTTGITEDSVEKIGPNNIIGTPVKITGAKLKKYNDSSSPKKMREGVSGMDKTFRDQVQTSLETDSRGTYSGLETGKVDRRDILAKKRKMKEWKDNQVSQEGLPDQEYLKDCRVTAKEAESENEYRRDKKAKALKSEGKESSASKPDKKGKVTRILVSSSKDQLANGLEEQSRGSYEKDHEWSQPRVQGVARRVSNGMDMLKRETGYTQPFVAATSSSSKVSCSLKNLANIQEVRGSPVESVSSSPMRMSKVEKPSLIGRNGLGMEDSIDGEFPCFASPRRFSDGEGDTQSDRSGPVKKIKSSRVELPGSHESCKAFQSSLLNSGKVDDNRDRDEKLFTDVNIKDKKSYQMDRSGNVTDHLVNNGSVVERPSERKDKDRSQEKIRDRYNSDGCQDRKVPREKIVRDQDREREKKPVHIKGKDKMHDSISDSHEELYIRGKDASRRSHEGPPETHSHSPYHESSRSGKEFVDDKRSNKSDKDRRNEIDWSGKTDSRTKKLGEMRRGNKLKHGLDDNTEVMPSDLHAKQNRDFISKHQNSGVVPRKDGKANIQKSSQQDLSRGGERISNHGLSDRNVQSETTTTRDKLQAIPCLGDKPNLQGHGSAIVSMSNRGTRAEGVATDVSYGEFSKVPREYSKADNLNGALNCRLKPPTSNGVSGRDPEGALSSPARRESGQLVITYMKEAKDLKHMADNIKSKGMDLESTSLYFNAALKFLKTASLMELSNVENARHGEITQSLVLYTETAKLCEYCALTYERNKEMAAAALAYKCMGVAHMRVVHSKHLIISRDQHELQMAFQSAPTGDSPSSSASDVDNLNNHALMDRSSANPGKVAGSPQVPADHVIVARLRPVYARVLQYTRDTIAAVEAFRKSENAFAVANGSLDDAKHESAGISAVKRVMDFQFNDIDTLLHLVKLAMDAMLH